MRGLYRRDEPGNLADIKKEQDKVKSRSRKAAPEDVAGVPPSSVTPAAGALLPNTSSNTAHGSGAFGVMGGSGSNLTAAAVAAAAAAGGGGGVLNTPPILAAAGAQPIAGRSDAGGRWARQQAVPHSNQPPAPGSGKQATGTTDRYARTLLRNYTTTICRIDIARTLCLLDVDGNAMVSLMTNEARRIVRVVRLTTTHSTTPVTFGTWMLSQRP
jgi:hypothetical protein